MIETETKTMGRRQKTLSYRGVHNFSRPSVRPSVRVVFVYSMSVRIFSMSVRVVFNVRPSVPMNPSGNKQKSI